MASVDNDERKRRKALTLAEREQQLALSDGMYGGQGDEDDDEAINLREYWQVIMRHKLTIFIFTMIALAASAIATSLQTPIYRSSAKIQIDREAARVLEYDGVTPREAAYSYDFYETQYELLKSRTLAKRVVDQLGLESSRQFMGKEQPSFFKDLKASLRALLSGEDTTARAAEETDSGPQKGLENLLLGNLTISPIKDSRLVVIHYDSPNPDLAAKVVNALAKSFINMSLERRFEASSYAKTFLADRIKQVRANLEDSERALVEYAGEREIIDFEQKQSVLMQKVEAVNAKLIEVEAERIEAESTFQEMNENRGLGMARVLDSPVIQTYKEALAELESEYEQNLRIYKPAYPKMVQLRGQIEELEKTIDEEVANIQAGLKGAYRASLREEAMLKSRMADLKSQVLELQRKSTDYQALKRDVETNRELYDGLLQRIKEVGVASGVGTNNISIIDPGEVPGAAYKPNMRRNLQMALIVGLVGGIGLAFLFEHLDDTVKSSADLEKLTGLPVLGVIPEISLQGEKGDSVAMYAYEQPKSALAEAYRSCRTALSFSTASGTPDILHISSSVASEGKTTTALSLALTFAQAGSNVLLIDADLRNPSLHKEFEADNEAGLTNYLAGDHRPSQVIQKSPVKGLYLLPTGPLPPNPAELLGSGKMLDLLTTAAKRFDLVLVDGPPTLGLADSLILANVADATIMVVDAGVTRTGSLTGSLQRLRQARANVIGAVLTKFGQGRTGYGYDYHYSYNYYSYAADDADEAPARRLAS